MDLPRNPNIPSNVTSPSWHGISYMIIIKLPFGHSLEFCLFLSFTLAKTLNSWACCASFLLSTSSKRTMIVTEYLKPGTWKPLERNNFLPWRCSEETQSRQERLQWASFTLLPGKLGWNGCWENFNGGSNASDDQNFQLNRIKCSHKQARSASWCAAAKAAAEDEGRWEDLQIQD